MTLPFNDKKFQFLLMAVAMVVALEILSLADIRIPMPYAPFVYAAFILGIGADVIRSGTKALFQWKFSNINLLMLIAVVGAYYLGEFPEAAVLVVLFVLGERLEKIGMENATSALDELVRQSPQTAFVKGLDERIPLDKIAVGAILPIKPGERIPLDGKVIAGETSVDESAITGESLPKDKSIGDWVYAGTLNKNGFIEIETTQLSLNTVFSRIVRITFEAQTNRSETQRFIQRFAAIYTPVVLLLSVLLLVIPVFVWGGELNHWLRQSITLLVIACPCALVLSTPVAVYAALGNAYSKGVLIKGGKYLEALAKIRILALDKTRTLTYGIPIVSDIIPFNGTSRSELLACTAGAELFSEHPLSQAIVNACRKEGLEPHAVEAFKSTPGKGATAHCLVCKDEIISVGTLDFIREKHATPGEAENIIHRLSSQGKTSVVVSFGNKIAGIIGLTDECKPDSAAAIQELRSLGIEPVMLSGDSQHAADYTAQQVGIQQVFGHLLPEDKAEKIKEFLQKDLPIAMVGDGINDAPALALSTVGIAMGSAGSPTAMETAPIVLMNDKLTLIPFLIRLSRKTVGTIQRNTLGAIGIKLFFIVLAFAGYSHLALAIAADVGVTLLVVLLSLRLMDFGELK